MANHPLHRSAGPGGGGVDRTRENVVVGHRPTGTGPVVTGVRQGIVGIVIGKQLHPMGPEHWIEHAQLSIGNEPAGTVFFRSHGYLKPEATLKVVLGPDLKGKKVSLVVTLGCNLHGI